MDKIIEQLATEYAEQCNSCYSNDYDGFEAGFKAAKAVEFAEWCTQKGYIKNGSPREWNLGGMFSKRYSDELLYEIFLNKQP